MKASVGEPKFALPATSTVVPAVALTVWLALAVTVWLRDAEALPSQVASPP